MRPDFFLHLEKLLIRIHHPSTRGERFLMNENKIPHLSRLRSTVYHDYIMVTAQVKSLFAHEDDFQLDHK